MTGVYRCYKQSNAYLMRRRRRSAVSPWNVDPLRRTTLRGIRSARRSRWKSSALNRKSCHASVLVMLEKRGGCCRADGPRRARSCQMLHTIAAINAAWCRSLRSASSPMRPTPPAGRSSSQVAASAESLTAHGRRAHHADGSPVHL